MGAAEQLTLDQQNAADRERRYVEAQLDARGAPERLNYAAGVLLDTRDFEDEQDYHRGRLGRVLAALFGFGTLAGLRVTCPVAANALLEVEVAPGLALDRLGRLVEVRRRQCLKVADWLAARATRSDPNALPPLRDEVIGAVVDGVGADAGGRVLRLDVWLRHVACAHGRTPAFAAGPFNATDYTVPARLADGFEIGFDLAADRDGATRLPANALQPLDVKLAELQALADADARADARRAWMLDAVLGGWVQSPADRPGQLAPLAEQRLPSHWARLFLARLTVPVKASGPADPFPQVDAARLPAAPADLADNRLRPIVFIPTAWRGQPA